jgi:hypothetical protein
LLLKAPARTRPPSDAVACRGERRGRGMSVLMMKDGSVEERVDLTSPSAPVRRRVMGQQSGNHGCGQVTSSSAKGTTARSGCGRCLVVAASSMQMTKKQNNRSPTVSKPPVVAMWKAMGMYIAHIEVTGNSSLTTWYNAGIRRGPLSAACFAIRRSRCSPGLCGTRRTPSIMRPLVAPAWSGPVVTRCITLAEICTIQCIFPDGGLLWRRDLETLSLVDM